MEIAAVDERQASDLAHSAGILISAITPLHEASPKVPPTTPQAAPGPATCMQCRAPLAWRRTAPTAASVILALIGIMIGIATSCFLFPFSALIGVPAIIYCAIRGSMGPLRLRCPRCG